jgi:hypothetical protein
VRDLFAGCSKGTILNLKSFSEFGKLFGDLLGNLRISALGPEYVVIAK